MSVIEIEKLSFKYPGQEKFALENITMSIEKGDFCIVSGFSGSGKTTLLRLLKEEIAPAGDLTGTIRRFGTTERTEYNRIGFVMQNSNAQTVTDKVWHELAFGLENMGLPQGEIRRRVAETASYFGIENWFNKDVTELSGGQLQLLNLAAVTTMEPDILILDEPVSQLDPISSNEYISAIVRLNRDIGMTIIISEHRYEELLPYANKLLLLEDGKVLEFGEPRDVLKKTDRDSDLFYSLPCAAKVYKSVSVPDDVQCPVSVNEGRALISTYLSGKQEKIRLEDEEKQPGKEIIETKELYYTYPDGTLAVEDFDLKIYRGEIFCILGGNGSGKSTLMKLLAGILKGENGKIVIDGKKIKKIDKNELYGKYISMLPQDSSTLFVKEKLSDELKSCSLKEIEMFGLQYLLGRHPFDLSGGELQKAAILKVISRKTDILLLDEPTKSVDYLFMNKLVSLFKELAQQGKTIIIVTHDPEFAAQVADRCGLMFNGNLIEVDSPRKFFSGNRYYTTSATKMSSGFIDGAIYYKDIADAIGDVR